jgi:hypothetical protein
VVVAAEGCTVSSCVVVVEVTAAGLSDAQEVRNIMTTAGKVRLRIMSFFIS